MGDSSKIKRFLSFDRIVGYATIAGSMATLYGVKKIYNLTVELKPVIEIIQEEQNANLQKIIIRDTITETRRDTVILRDTVFLPLRASTPIPENKKWDRINQTEAEFRRRHQLP